MPNLTPPQKEAVEYSGDSAVVASAGSGKTLVIVEKVVRLAGIGRGPIAVVTFTEKAAVEIGERIERRLNGLNKAVFIGTIHALCASLLRRFGKRVGIDPEFRILDGPLSDLERLRSARETLIRMVEEGEGEALEAIDRLGGFRETVRTFIELIRKTDAPERSPFPVTLSRIGSEYDRRKRERNLLDYDDLERFAKATLQNTDEARCFAEIIVDEFQDTSPLQWKIVSLLRDGGRNRLTAVGDPRQSIYRFRGADPLLFEKVSEEIRGGGGRIFCLSENFRSTPPIIGFVNRATGGLFPSLPPLTAKREGPGGVEVINVPNGGNLTATRRLEAEASARRIAEMVRDGTPPGSIALLFRTRRAARFYEEELKRLNIPHEASIGESLPERGEVVAAVSWMRRRSSKKGSPLLDAIIEASPLAPFNEEIPPETLGDFIKTFFEKIAPLFPDGASGNLAAFKGLCESLAAGGIGDLPALVTAIRDLREEGGPITVPSPGGGGGVRLHTIHGAKGLEFPVVFLCDLAAGEPRGRHRLIEDDEGAFLLREADREAPGLKRPLLKDERFDDLKKAEKGEAAEESKRLFYVALTRATERLILPLPPASDGGKGKNTWSEWLHAAIAAPDR